MNNFFFEYRWWLTGCSVFQRIELIQARIGFGILDAVLAIWNNSEIVYYFEMPIPSGSTCPLDKLQGGPLKSSPENVVKKRNIVLLFKLTVALFK